MKARALGALPVQYFVMAIFFLLLVLGVVFLLLWATQAGQVPRLWWFLEGTVFLTLLGVGWFYAMHSGALTLDSRLREPPAKDDLGES